MKQGVKLGFIQGNKRIAKFRILPGQQLLIGKKKSNVSTSNFDEKNLENLIERSVKHTKVSPEDEFVGLPKKENLEKKLH